jgi:Tfp pilus assembly PilM family ATPase
MKFTKIFDAFPTPKFLDIPFAGLSISDSAIHCIAFGKKHNALFIEKYAQKTIPPGIVTSGQVNNIEEMVAMLQTIKKDLDLKYIKVSLPEEKAYLFTAKIPILSKEEVYSAVESQIEDNVPVSPSELVFDYKVIPHEAADHLDVVVSALPASVVNMYVEIAEKSGLSLLSLEIESQAIARALLPKSIPGTVLVIHFGTEKVGLYVVTKRVVHFTSTIPLYAMTVGTSPIEHKAELTNNLSFLSQEIKKLYAYWHTLKENVDDAEKKIERIIVCGSNLADETISYLSSNNETPVEYGNVWTNVLDINKTVPPISFADSLEYAASIGLALHGDLLV